MTYPGISSTDTSGLLKEKATPVQSTSKCSIGIGNSMTSSKPISNKPSRILILEREEPAWSRRLTTCSTILSLNSLWYTRHTKRKLMRFSSFKRQTNLALLARRLSLQILCPLLASSTTIRVQVACQRVHSLKTLIWHPPIWLLATFKGSNSLQVNFLSEQFVFKWCVFSNQIQS